jgi:hypothetical protein
MSEKKKRKNVDEGKEEKREMCYQLLVDIALFFLSACGLFIEHIYEKTMQPSVQSM